MGLRNFIKTLDARTAPPEPEPLGLSYREVYDLTHPCLNPKHENSKAVSFTVSGLGGRGDPVELSYICIMTEDGRQFLIGSTGELYVRET